MLHCYQIPPSPRPLLSISSYSLFNNRTGHLSGKYFEDSCQLGLSTEVVCCLSKMAESSLLLIIFIAVCFSVIDCHC